MARKNRGIPQRGGQRGPGTTAPSQVPPDPEIKGLLSELTDIHSTLVSQPPTQKARLKDIDPAYQASAVNLLHYLALRRRDLRSLQEKLAKLGLSSLGRAESHVLATVEALLAVLHQLQESHWRPPTPATPALNFTSGRQLLADHTRMLLGPDPTERAVRIMVTMPGEAAHNYTLVHDLLERGMDGMRINCAHDSAPAWSDMIQHLRRAEQALGRSCQVIMDLAGPKLRTGPLEHGPNVVKIRPKRDLYGRVIAPARVWLTADSQPVDPPSPATVCIQLPVHWLAALQPGNVLKFRDSRNARRSLKLVEVSEGGCWAEASKTAYIVPGLILSRKDKDRRHHKERKARVTAVPARENAIFLKSGDPLIVTRNQEPGRPGTLDSAGELLTPPRIGCTIPEVFSDVQPGEAIWFDDGKIGGIIEQVQPHQVLVRITRTRLTGANLRADKGINLPESNLQLTALTATDLKILPFLAEHADIIELSFASTPRDVEELQQQLEKLGGKKPSIVLKVETRRGFENLPDMLLTAMRAPCCGVMIARGDLAVECGFERLAEVQEEILWICEAAHVPVIWATQVLETLAREGMPSRAEITDAAMGHRAECVMLNKGAHIVSAVQVLDDILKRMQAHQTKKQSMLRELHLAHALGSIDGSTNNEPETVPSEPDRLPLK